MTETKTECLTLADGRSIAHAELFAKMFEKAVKSPHRTTSLRRNPGYGPTSFDVAYIEENGTSSGRFVRVTVEPFRDADLAERLNRDIASGS